ncbi:hypothetical protein [Actinoplanes subtropicus]|uniref:hypothetical protein n=1 Tax=Actinoplanes subtropicus TaxID=543632 RepID=UPI0004C3EF74|nr:hypothetical protein [Actinoplanes subtropicus]
MLGRRRDRRPNEDNSWWQKQEGPLDDSLACRTWVVALTLFARAQVVQASIARMNEILTHLTEYQFATVVTAVRRYTTHAAPRRLDLYAPLHSRTMAPAARTALLLHLAAFDATRPELDASSVNPSVSSSRSVPT